MKYDRSKTSVKGLLWAVKKLVEDLERNLKNLKSQKKFKIKIKIRVHDKWAEWQLYDLHYSQKKKQ